METDGRGFGVDVDLRETALEEPPGRGHCFRSVAHALEGHQPAVGLLGITVELDRAPEHLLRGVRRAELLLQFSEAKVRVERPAMEVLADRLDPLVIGVLDELAPITAHDSAERIAGRWVVAGTGSIRERGLELPEVAVNRLGVEAVGIADLDEELGRGSGDPPDALTDVRHRSPGSAPEQADVVTMTTAESMQALSNPPSSFLRLIETLGRRNS